MIRFKPPTMGIDISDVFKTSPGRINPRTGKLVQYKEYEPIAPWELEERGRGRGRSEDRARFRRDFEDRPRSRRDFDEGDDISREYPRPRRDYGEFFRSGMSGKSMMGQAGEYFGNAIPWIFLGVATIVALEASGITKFSSPKVG
jgi:hypothetical protein